jgi:hypothetical protein
MWPLRLYLALAVCLERRSSLQLVFGHVHRQHTMIRTSPSAPAGRLSGCGSGLGLTLSLRWGCHQDRAKKSLREMLRTHIFLHRSSRLSVCRDNEKLGFPFWPF